MFDSERFRPASEMSLFFIFLSPVSTLALALALDCVTNIFEIAKGC